MKIGQLASAAGTTATTIRYYESIGLLDAPARTPSGYREYGDESVERLRFVRDAQETGLTLTEIASILELKAAGVSTCEHTRSLLRLHLDDLDEQIERLTRTREQLTGLAARADGLDHGECTDAHRCHVIATLRGPDDSTPA